MTSTIQDATGTEFPVWKQGSRWICEGPQGRFFARTKTDAQRLLVETGGRYDAVSHPDKAVRESQTGTPTHHPDCPRGQHCWCPAGLYVPGYADSADGQADAADQARWDGAR